MERQSKILVCGSTGLVGSAIVRNLLAKGYENVHGTYCRTVPGEESDGKVSYHQVNLMDQGDTASLFEYLKPEYVVLAAAKVGGIVANNIYRADFIYQNLQIQNHVIHESYRNGVKKLLFLGSTCIYPKECPQPIREEYLLTGPLEYTNEPYAIAKIAGIKMCESFNLQYGTNYISVMPTNLYGPNDNFDLEKSHVLPALVRKMHLGKALLNDDWETIEKDLDRNPIEGVDGGAGREKILSILSKYGVGGDPVRIEIWGTGKPKREFLYSDDMADACVFLMERIDFEDTFDKETKEIRNTHINIGTGVDVSIRELAETIRKIVGFDGELYFNTEKPDGTMRKVTDPSKLHALGWKHRVELEEGIRKIYDWYRA
ncbi:GDP-L-fucose synthase family protein [Hydrogenimonas sp.]